MSHHSAKLEPHRLNGERTMSELKKSPLRCADDTQGEAQAQRLVRRSGALASCARGRHWVRINRGSSHDTLVFRTGLR
jgi:hypothetical protein